MFSLFKRKQNLVSKDVTNGILTSNFVSFKIGEKLTVPENIVCIVRYKDKTYNELSTGEYALNKEFLLDLYTKQLKGKEKINNLKADLYYINLNSFNFEFEYVDKIPINKINEKFLINIKLSIRVQDIKLFFKNFIYENTAPTAETSTNLIIEYAENCLRKCFLKQSLTSVNIDNELYNHLNQTLTKFFNKVGLSVENFSINLFKKTNNTSKKEPIKTSKPGVENIASTDSAEKINLTENLNLSNKTQNEQETSLNQTSNICPNCNNKLISGSIFCHKCGYKK